MITSRELIKSVLAGTPTSRPPVSTWMHFPEKDQSAEDLARESIKYQNEHKWDFLKFMPPGDYATIDWGLKSEFVGSPAGNRAAIYSPVSSINDWSTLSPLDVLQGFNGVVLEALRMTRKGVSYDVPILQTIFSPLTIAHKLSDGKVVDHLRSHPAIIDHALEIITQVTCDMVQASYEAGADGMYFATQLATSEILSEDEYRDFGLVYDHKVFERSARINQEAITFLHVHGVSPMLSLSSELPSGIINWHSLESGPPLKDGYDIVAQPVAGGINREAIRTCEPEEVAFHIKETVATMSGHPLVITPGCGLRVDTPAANVDAIVQVRDEMKSDVDHRS